MTASGLLAVGIGAALGAWLRWWLGLALNAVLPSLPLGTLAANLVGGYCIGVAIALFDRAAGVPPEVRLLVITGFLGALTTFSTFSAEIVALIGRAQYAWAAAGAAAHLFGSLAMTGLGVATINLLRG